MENRSSLSQSVRTLASAREFSLFAVLVVFAIIMTILEDVFLTKANIEAIRLEKNRDGDLNIRSLTALSLDQLKEPIDQARRVTPKYLIDRLELSYGKIIFTEYGSQEEPFVTETDLKRIKDVFGYVTEPELFVQVSVIKALSALNRGALGIPRGSIQRRLLENSGKPRV